MQTFSWNPVITELKPSEIKIAYASRDGILPSGAPVWLSETIERLYEFARFKENWDSYGASPPAEGLRNRALQMLLSSNLSGVPKPFVVPRKDGGINFEWDSGEKFLSLEVRKEGMKYFFFDRKNAKSIEKEYKEKNLDSLTKEFL